MAAPAEYRDELDAAIDADYAALVQAAERMTTAELRDLLPAKSEPRFDHTCNGVNPTTVDECLGCAYEAGMHAEEIRRATMTEPERDAEDAAADAVWKLQHDHADAEWCEHGLDVSEPCDECAKLAAVALADRPCTLCGDPTPAGYELCSACWNARVTLTESLAWAERTFDSSDDVRAMLRYLALTWASKGWSVVAYDDCVHRASRNDLDHNLTIGRALLRYADAGKWRIDFQEIDVPPYVLGNVNQSAVYVDVHRLAPNYRTS